MRLYLAGAMGGIPQFNFPAFERWARELRSMDYSVTSPHESDPPQVQAEAWASPDGDFSKLSQENRAGHPETMRRNTEDLLRVDGVALIPGWEKSLGTRHEIAMAERLGLPVAPVWLWAMSYADDVEDAMAEEVAG